MKYRTIFQKKLQGGSTLTQQLVKNALLTPERTIRRKLREFALTLMVEIIYSKDQILCILLMRIEMWCLLNIYVDDLSAMRTDLSEQTLGKYYKHDRGY